MTTTYVFGAGASHHAGYPLASEMGEGLIRNMLSSEDLHSRPYAEYLIDQFGRLSNIEDLITQIQSSLDAIKGSANARGKTEYTRLGNRLGYLGRALRQWFREIHAAPAAAYAKFAGKVIHSGDSVITFNYDDSLERELRDVEKWDVSLGYGFQLGATQRPSDVLVLKLHGSVNWLISLFGGATGGSVFAIPPGGSSMGRHPVLHRADLQYLGYELFSGQVYEGGGVLPCLILPGRKKEFFYDTSLGEEYREFWNGLWSQAKQALERSDTIVICGYSLPLSDQRARDLLLKGARKEARVKIVCGGQSERIAEDFAAAGFHSVMVSIEQRFEDWVEMEAERIAPPTIAAST
jgi:hypothetical protein